MSFRDDIYSKCLSFYEGQEFSPMKYDQYVKNPFLITKIIENMDKINDLYKTLLSSGLNKINRTDKGTIVKNDIKHVAGAWDCRKILTTNNIFKGVIITVIIKNRVFVIKCGSFSVNNATLSGPYCYRKFQKECKNFGVNLDKYKISNGEEVKRFIQPPIIKMLVKYKQLEHVHHLDLNAAWCWGCTVDYPEFAPVFESLRKKNKLFGDIALGYCQSEYIKYSLSNLSKSGINNTNDKIIQLTKKLLVDGFKIIGYNTDGIWYKDNTPDNRVYHDEEEGQNLGQWKNDYQDCTFLAYSDGQYWFKTPDGKFHPRARGYYLYEQIKAREEWDEYDFDKAMGSAAKIIWDDKEGFVLYEER